MANNISDTYAKQFSESVMAEMARSGILREILSDEWFEAYFAFTAFRGSENYRRVDLSLGNGGSSTLAASSKQMQLRNAFKEIEKSIRAFEDVVINLTQPAGLK